jgi:hypothetical protein
MASKGSVVMVSRSLPWQQGEYPRGGAMHPGAGCLQNGLP